MPSKKHEHASNAEIIENTTLLEWKAPGRPFKKRSKQYFLTALLIFLLVEIILFLFSEYLLMFVVAALLFVTFALSSTAPKVFTFRISTEGFQIEDRFFLWEELYDFYFLKKEGQDTLHIRTQAFLPGELIVTLGDVSRDVVKKDIIRFLPFREYVKPTVIERIGEWLSKNFPLES